MKLELLGTFSIYWNVRVITKNVLLESEVALERKEEEAEERFVGKCYIKSYGNSNFLHMGRENKLLSYETRTLLDVASYYK